MMHPDFLQVRLNDHARELEQSMRLIHDRRAPEVPEAVTNEAVLLRLCRVQDDAALARLAELEGQPAPIGRFIVAEVGGTVVAALPIGCGSLLADPFRSTAHLVPLLELRARQLGDECSHRGAFAIWGTVRGWVRA
jgi:hypothetical protein